MKIGILTSSIDERALLKHNPALVLAPEGLVKPFGLATRMRDWASEMDGVVVNTRYVAKWVGDHIPSDVSVAYCYGNATAVGIAADRLIQKLEDAFDRREETSSHHEETASSSDPQQQEDVTTVVDSMDESASEVVVKTPGPVEATTTQDIEEPTTLIEIRPSVNGRINWSELKSAVLGQVFQVFQAPGQSEAQFRQVINSSRHNYKINHGIETLVEFLKGSALLKVDGLRTTTRRSKGGLSGELLKDVLKKDPFVGHVILKKDAQKESAPVTQLPVQTAAPQPQKNPAEAEFWKTVFTQRVGSSCAVEQAAQEADQALEMYRQRFASL